METLQKLPDTLLQMLNATSLDEVVLIVIGAWLLAAVLGRLMPGLMVGRASRKLTAPRRETLSNLITGTTHVVVYTVAVVLILSLYFPGSSVLTALGLFSAGVSFAARPYFSDIIGGMSLLFDDHYSVGEKVQLLDVSGYIEDVQLRNTYIRADSGELLIVPNGEVRIVRNFTRSSFSLASVQVSVPREQVPAAMKVLRSAAAQFYADREDIVEEPQVLSESGLLSTETLLTVKVKARFGEGPRVRNHLITRIYRSLAEQNIIAKPEATPDPPTVPVNTAEIKRKLKDELAR